MTPTLEAAWEIVAAIRARGRTAVLAGGAVRDQVLGRPLTDVDIATDMPLDELSALFRTHAVGRSEDFETVVVSRGGQAYEISRLRGGVPGGPAPEGREALRADAAHRDFTINAMLMEPGGGVLDFHGGLRDLRASVVRAVGDPGQRFAEDPARLLRAVRFAACLGFEIESATAAAIRADATRLSLVAGERLGAEVLKMAAQPGAALARGVLLLEELGLLRTVLPEIADLRGLPHPPDKHPEGGVYEHTLAALRASHASDPAVNLAVLLHDIGKRPAHFVEDGRPRYHGHERAGRALVEAAARRLFLPQRLRAAILFAVEHHGRCARMAELRRSKRHALLDSPHWPVLRALAVCDVAARGAGAASRHLEEVLREAERDAAAFAERRRGAPLLTGARVMELTGLSPGPRVGEILRLVTEWALDNRVEDRARIEAEVVQEQRRGTERSERA